MCRKIETLIIWSELCLCCILVMTVLWADKWEIRNSFIGDKWRIEYPFDENKLERYLSLVEQIKKVINKCCTLYFPHENEINTLVSNLEDNIYHYHITDISDFIDNRDYISECVENVNEFNSQVNSLGIPFFYIQTPSKASIDFYNNKEIAGDASNIAERNNYLTTELEDAGIDVINIARDYSDKISFDSTGHWRPEDGFAGAKLLATKLSNEYDFDIDLSIYDEQNYYDLFSLHPQFSRLMKQAGYDFKVPCPNYETELVMLDSDDKTWKGSFEEVLFRDSYEWNIQKAYFGVYRILNSTYSISNIHAKCDKKVLIIGDSFNWPIASYLSLSCRDIAIIHNASFTGSIVSYVKSTRPDIVIMIYNDAEFYEIYTEDAFFLK